MNTTNVLYIESGSGFGGSSKCLYLLLKNSADSSIHPSVIYYNFGPNIEVIEKLGIKTKKCSILLLLHEIAAADVIYINNELYSHIFNILLAKLFNKRCICHMRGIRPLTKMEKAVSKFVDTFIAVSKTCKENLMKQGIPKEKIDVIYDGVEIDHEIKNGQVNGIINIGVVSRIVPKKGHSTFIDSADMLLKRWNNVRFLVYGDDTQKNKPTIAGLKEMVRSKKLSERIFFQGWQTDTEQIYKDIDIAVCPSQMEESFGMNVAEAMAFGKPAIASHIGAYSELINDGVNGLLFSAGDASDLASKIDLLIKDASLRKGLSLVGRRTASDNFDIKNNVRKIERIIKEDTDGRKD